MSTPAPRPAGVTLVAVLTYISGALSVIAGIVIILLRNNAEVKKAAVDAGIGDALLALGIIEIVIGVITLLVAGGLRRGSSFARMLVTVLMLLSLGSAIWWLIKFPGQAASTWVSIAISVIVLILLWTSRASAFFRSH